MADDPCLERHSEALDPRIKDELEKLNESTKAINRLEIELDESRADFRQALTDSTHSLNVVAKKLGGCIDKARPYYEARHKAKEVQWETQKAALRYEKANSMLAAAKEMLDVAESGVYGRKLDANWQEMLNHATMKVNQAEWERSMSELEHQRTANLFNSSEKQISKLQKSLKKHITKSRPYFEMKAKLSHQLEEFKHRVTRLEQGVQGTKLCYSQALRSLEAISEEIHQRRKERQMLGSEQRGSGVGAEAQDTLPFREEEEAVVEAARTRRQISGSSDLFPGDELGRPDDDDDDPCRDPHAILANYDSIDHLDQIGSDEEDELVGQYAGLGALAKPSSGGRTANCDQPEGAAVVQGDRTADCDQAKGAAVVQGDRTADCDQPEGAAMVQGDRTVDCDQAEGAAMVQGDHTADCDQPEGAAVVQGDRTADCDQAEGAAMVQGDRTADCDQPEGAAVVQGDCTADCDQPEGAAMVQGDRTADSDQSGSAATSEDGRTADCDQPGSAVV